MVSYQFFIHALNFTKGRNSLRVSDPGAGFCQDCGEGGGLLLLSSFAFWIRMDAHRKAREYLEKHGVERWFRTAAEKLIVAQPENPFSLLHETLGHEVAAREEHAFKRQGEGGYGNGEGVPGGASLVAQITVRGRDGSHQVISLDKVANDDMAGGARGAVALRGWGTELGSKVTSALLGNDGVGGGVLNNQVSHALVVGRGEWKLVLELIGQMKCLAVAELCHSSAAGHAIGTSSCSSSRRRRGLE